MFHSSGNGGISHMEVMSIQKYLYKIFLVYREISDGTNNFSVNSNEKDTKIKSIFLNWT